MIRIQEKLCMGMKNPIGVTMDGLEFEWIVESDSSNVIQSFYRIVVRTEGGDTIWDSDLQESESCCGVYYTGPELNPRTVYEWVLTVMDNEGNTAVRGGDWFETGFGCSETWTGKWISPNQFISEDAFCDWPNEQLVEHFGPVSFLGLDKGNTEGVAPAYYLRKTFQLKPAKISKARLYITAGGIYDASLNGIAVTDTLLNPGFTPYDKFFEYQTYDVTGLLEERNVLSVLLADGWYKGRVGIGGLRELYGKRTTLLAELHVEYEDGNEEIIVTDQSWKSAKGPYEYADLFVGEFYDARKELTGWERYGYDDSEWTDAEEVQMKPVRLEGCCVPPPRVIERIQPISLYKNDIGETILDLGQNIAGFVKATFYNMEPGTEVIFEHTEMLDENGHYLNTVNLECEELIDHYICKGGSSETYCPKFTFHGFRYVRITGLNEEAVKEDFEGRAIANDLRRTLSFRSDNEKINRLNENIYWSQMGNYLCIPTDCPQREKSGWTGDAFVYSDTAGYVQDVRLFLKRWLKMIRMEQFENGLIPVTVPYTKNYYYIQEFVFHAHTSCGWGDAIIEVPWVLYQQYGDISFLKDNYEAMKKWMQYVEADAASGRKAGYESMTPEQQARQKYLWNTGFHYGDWSYPSCRNAKGETDNMQSSLNTREYVATALYAHSCGILSKTAEELGDTETARYYSALQQKIRKAFDEEYVSEDASLPLQLQGLYVLTLATGMVSEDKAEKMAAKLNDLIAENGYCLDTGFMSIKFLMDVLMKYGYQDTAAKLLLQEKCPSWLYEINNGATTVWAKWNAVQPETGKVTCASYNHYSFGSVGKWIYNNILGIRNSGVGFRNMTILPGFDFPFNEVEGTYSSVRGDIHVHWLKSGKSRRIDLTVPVSSTASVILKNCDESSLNNGFAGLLKGETLTLGSGSYRIIYSVK